MVAWILLLALAPSVTFLGHWPSLQFDIPGTDAYVQVPLTGAHEQPGEDHERHCHGDSSGCSDSPGSLGVSLGLVQDAHGLFATDALLLRSYPAPNSPLTAAEFGVEPPPPRLAASLFA